LPLDLIGETIARTEVEEFVADYERLRENRKKENAVRKSS